MQQINITFNFIFILNFVFVYNNQKVTQTEEILVLKVHAREGNDLVKDAYQVG